MFSNSLVTYCGNTSSLQVYNTVSTDANSTPHAVDSADSIVNNGVGAKNKLCKDTISESPQVPQIGQALV